MAGRALAAAAAAAKLAADRDDRRDRREDEPVTTDEAKGDMIGEELARSERLEQAMPTLRERIIALLPDAHPDWVRQAGAGDYDDGPVMRAAIAGWLVAHGVGR